MKKYGIPIGIAAIYIITAIYFQSLCLGLSMLTFFFGLFWFKEADKKRQQMQEAQLWWVLGYGIPVIISFMLSIALIAFAINVYFGVWVLGWIVGILVTGLIGQNW